MITESRGSTRHQMIARRRRATISAGIGTLLLLAACGSGTTTASTSTAATTAAGSAPTSAATPASATLQPTSGTSPAVPASSGLKPIDQAALQALVDTTIKDQLIPGAVVVLNTPQGNFTITAGTTERGVQSPPDADTHFRIASNTKTMTSAVVLQLAQEGKLELE